MNRARKASSALLGKILDSVTTAEMEKVHVKMALAVKISDALSASGMSKSAFAAKLGKRPSEITKWLSGTHNFTIETLVEIADALDLKLVELFGQQMDRSAAVPLWQQGLGGMQTPYALRGLSGEGQQMLVQSTERTPFTPYLA